ncbi:MAG: PAN/Apple domain-containing protein [Glycocaulis sp.]
MILAALLASLTLGPGLPAGAILHGEERRGAVLMRPQGAARESWQACAQACEAVNACQAWTYHAWQTRCTLHAAPLTPRPFPGAVTGLSPSLASRIEEASERELSLRELEAVRAMGAPSSRPPADPRGELFPQR